MSSNHQPFQELPLVLSVDELAAILNIGRNTAYNLIRSGQIQSIRVGHQIRISRNSLLRFIGAEV